MKTFTKIPETEAYIEVKNITKIYPETIKIFEYKKPKRLKDPLLELENKQKKGPKKNKQTPEDLLRSLRRSRTTIQDLVICNKFELFCTFTFKSDRQDVELCKRKMSNWLQSQQKKHKIKLKYLIVPEFHKDGKSIHFHALISNYKGNLLLAKKKSNNRNIYNITSYRSGFSTAIKIDNHDKVSSYIRKYITKDMPSFANKRRYWMSHNLVRPEIVYNHFSTNMPFVDKSLVYENDYLSIYESQVKLKSSNKEV